MTGDKETPVGPGPTTDNSDPRSANKVKALIASARKSAKPVNAKDEPSAGAVESMKKKGTSRSGKTKIATVTPFNPLRKEVLGGAIAHVLLSTKVYPLKQELPFKGAGIYALYYTGGFSPYEKISKRNREEKFELPIYVGQALPSGGRTGLKVTAESSVLRRRLSKHKSSIEEISQAEDSSLNIDDFHYRALVLDDTFIRLGESSLIALFAPLWNVVVPGFGNNDPGKGRKPIMSRWDTLHPGRKQASDHDPREEPTGQIETEIRAALSSTILGHRALILAEGQSEVAALPVDLEVRNADTGEAEEAIDEKE